MKRFLFKFFFVLFALIVALPAQAVTVFVKGSTSPYVKVGDSYQQLTSSVTTSGVTWYYADVADNSTISFATDNNGSKASPSFTVTTGSAYFYYDGNSNAVNMTDMKDKASYCMLEVTTDYWYQGGAIFKIWDSKSDIDMTAIGGNGTNKYVYLYAQNAYTVNDNTGITFKRCNPDGGGQWDWCNSNYSKGAYYAITGWKDSHTKTNPAEYKDIVWPEKPAPTNYTYALHGQITGEPNWKSTAMTDEGNGIWSLTGDFVVGEFGIKKMDGNTDKGWLGWSNIGTPADNCEDSGNDNNIKLTVAGNYTISFNTADNKITVKANSTPTPTPTTYYLKHPWGGGDWVWQVLTKDNGDGTYSLEGKYCKGAGCNWSTASDGKGSKWIPSPTVIGNPATGDNCTFTLNPTANNGEGAITITRVGALTKCATPTIAPEGGTFTSAQIVTITSEEGATIYYTTDGNDPTTDSKVYNGAFKVNTVGTTTVKAIAVKEGYDISAVASKTYTINKPYSGDVYISGGVVKNNNFNEGTGNIKMTESESGIYTYEFSMKEGVGNFWAFRTNNGSAWKWLTNKEEVTPTKSGTYSEQNTAQSNCFYYPGMESGKKYRITLNTIEGTVSIQKLAGGTAGDIPVYPAGVNSEAELNAYDFEANPVYYLLADVLNDNRVTPEWQLTKGAEDKYYLNGFAMRNTGAVKVRQYTSAGTYVDYDSKAFTTALNTSEGQLYNATFNPTDNSLTLTPASGTKMPFISLVGYMMQQDQVYDTPRGVEKTPEGTKTSKGWQEAWLQYDANGKLLKDRAGNVMYSTMWPPKNPVYFTATIGSNQRLYSSDQMTFVPVQKDGNNVGKTGAKWKEDLQALDAEAYANLNLDDSKTYYRYVVSDIWYVGAGKIWTGWGGETTYDNNKQIAQWSKHKNWGYEDKNATDTEGTAIDAQKTYNVKQSAGNFLFENPTYFKTFEFFYETGNPNANSQIYTTLAYGSASIAAQNVKEGDSYTKGSYQAKVSLPEGSGVTVSSWTITRYDATTNKLAPISSDNGVVATGDGTNFPTSTEFTEDKGGLGEGRYYYELTVTFSNTATSTERTSTVRSNPFVIYFPNQYSVDANGYQLVKLDTAIDGYDYVTYNAKANGDLYFVNLTTDNKVANFRVATSAERETVNGYFATNSGIKWTDKVFVYAPVPAEFKQDAEKTNATVNLDQIVNYDVNATKGVSPVNYELAVVDNKGDFANKAYKAVMNYKEKDASTGALGDVKSSLGKENLTVMQMPNVKGGEATVTVTPTKNSAKLPINYNGTTKSATPSYYYNVSVELPFSDPNVEATNAPQYEVKVTDAKGTTTTKVYTADGPGERKLTFTYVNPLDFEGKSIEVNAKYYDGESYNLYANLGESAKLASGTVKFTGCTPDFHTLNAIASKAPELDGNGNMIKDDQGYHKQKNVIVVTNLGVSHDGTDDKIGGESVAASNALYNADFYLQNAATYNGIYTKKQLNFAATEEFENGHHVWKNGAIIFDNKSGVTVNPELKVEITPFYVAKVTNTEGTVGLTVQGGSATQGDETYVALTCKTAVKDRLELVTSVTDITESANVKAYKVIENGEIYIIYGDRKFNVMGAEVK